MSKSLAICILKGKKWDLFDTNIYPTKQGENLYWVERWAYHINFAVFLRWKSCNPENGKSLSFILPATCHLFFVKDFPDTFVAILLGLVGKSMQTSVRSISLLMSTDKEVLYKELYKSCTSFWSPKVGLTEISLCKSTLFFFSEILLPFLASPFYLKSVLTLPLTGVSWICAIPRILFLRNDRKTSLSSVNPLQIIMWEKHVALILQSCCLCGFVLVFFQYFILKLILCGSIKHAFVCLFYYSTLVFWGHDQAALLHLGKTQAVTDWQPNSLLEQQLYSMT